MKTIINLDRVRVCLKQPENFFDSLYEKYHDNPSREIHFDDGYYLSFDSDEKVNDKDITAKLFLDDYESPVELGTFTFNKSVKYGTKCFFVFATKSLYTPLGYVNKEKYNYFNIPFEVFANLGLVFNNVTSIEIACDTEASMISRIQYAIGKPEVFDMILLWKKVKNPEEILDGYWEYYQRSRIRKASRPTLYIHSTIKEPGNNQTLKVYDKARELAQSRPDKDVLIRTWNGMSNKIQRLEISIENRRFKSFFEVMNRRYSNKWIEPGYSSDTKEQRTARYHQGLEHFLYDIGMEESLRAEMFEYFANHLLHFKLRNHDKTQISILDLLVNNRRELSEL